ncbi:MAG: cupin domain-containing protein [Geminicoccaceae bacterium]
MTKPIINVADAATETERSGAHFEYTMTALAGALGAKAIGANITRIPPGKAAFPFHHHHANEEHFFVLSGVGVLRHGSAIYDVRANDYIVNLPGDASRAHQLINNGEDDLVFLAISTRVAPEVVGYPDSAKTGVRASALDRDDGRFLIADKSKNELS